ncbi:MAG TPA: hypothetical protein DCM38_12395 [Gammaproteobacteria bacterium]|nr:hypothetical protein [Gammaproteobacteria bacterium]
MIEVNQTNPTPIVVSLLSGTEVECVTSDINTRSSRFFLIIDFKINGVLYEKTHLRVEARNFV